MDRPDERWVAELPSGIIKNPKFCVAGDDLWPNDVVWLSEDTVYPMYDDTNEMYGVIAGKNIRKKGQTVLLATDGESKSFRRYIGRSKSA